MASGTGEMPNATMAFTAATLPTGVHNLMPEASLIECTGRVLME